MFVQEYRVESSSEVDDGGVESRVRAMREARANKRARDRDRLQETDVKLLREKHPCAREITNVRKKRKRGGEEK